MVSSTCCKKRGYRRSWTVSRFSLAEPPCFQQSARRKSVAVRKRRDKTGAELGMQEPHSESLANFADLESCAGGGDIAGEALTEALAGRLSSREIPLSGRRPRGLRGNSPRRARGWGRWWQHAGHCRSEAQRSGLRPARGQPRLQRLSAAALRLAGGSGHPRVVRHPHGPLWLQRNRPG